MHLSQRGYTSGAEGAWGSCMQADATGGFNRFTNLQCCVSTLPTLPCSRACADRGAHALPDTLQGIFLTIPKPHYNPPCSHVHTLPHSTLEPLSHTAL